MAELPTGTITFLFTDVQGSTRLWERHPDAMRLAMAQHDSLVERCVASNSGQVVRPRGEGDSRFAVFERAPDAIAAARDIQQEIARVEWPVPAPLSVRIALHTGEADLRAGDYYGTAVNRCARLRSLAYGGQTLLSEPTFELTRDQVPPGAALRDLGEHRLKDLERAEHVYQLIIAGLPADFPPLKSLDTLPNNLPVQLTSFVGREKEMAKVKAQLAATRLLTLTGSGGTGKTRLALQVAADLLEGFPDGVWFADLAPLSDAELVPQTVASILGVREQPGRTLIAVLNDHVASKTLLLLLDNCEHLVDACARLAESLVRAGRSVRILATSREALGIAGEVAWPVPSLTLPDTHVSSVEQLSQSEAVRLFLDRALAVQPHFQLGPTNAGSVAQISTRLDGIPLALELAASRLRALSVEQLAARLDDRFRLLTGGSRTALPRQQTLRALIDWSFGLISEPERVIFRRLAVFMGGWTLDAAEAVCGDADPSLSPLVKGGRREVDGAALSPLSSGWVGEVDVLDLLTHLVDKSLVVAKSDDQQGMRYRMLETIRQYAREKLVQSDEMERLRDAHLAYFCDWVQEAQPKMQTRDRAAWFTKFDAEYDNLRSAITWALDRDTDRALRIVAALPQYWGARGYLTEGRNWAEQALARDAVEAASRPEASKSRSAIRADALLALGQVCVAQGQDVAARRALEEAARLIRESGDRHGLPLALGLLSLISGQQGDAKRVWEYSKEAIDLAEAAGDKAGSAMAYGVLGRFAYELDRDIPNARIYLQRAIAINRELNFGMGLGLGLLQLAAISAEEGDYDKARSLLAESMALYQGEGNRQFVNLTRSHFADVARAQGDYKTAIELYDEVLRTWRDLGNPGAAARCIECLGFIFTAQSAAPDVADRQGLSKKAARLFGAAAALRESSASIMEPPEHIEYERELAKLSAQLDGESLKAAWAEGRSIPIEQVIQSAIAEQ
jgi:predicted ATPase/class 3 adenylate cyclase